MTKKILCVGFCTIDVINYVNEERLEDCKIDIIDERKCIGGNATNTANVLKQLGSDIDLCSVLAKNDPEIEELLAGIHLKTETCFYRNGKFPFSTIVVNESNGSRTIFHHSRNLPEIQSKDFELKFAETLGNYSWIHLEGRNYKNLEKIIKFIDDFKKVNNRPDIIVSIQFEFMPSVPCSEDLFKLANVLFISKEFVIAKGWNSAIEALNEMKEKFEGLRNTTIICPWGKEGAYGIAPNSKKIEWTIGSPVKAVDTLGAGDCFIAGVIWAMNQKIPLLKCLEIGVFVESGKCEQIGVCNLSHLKNVKKFTANV
uniref:Carbohydrate kinase PfkB domain-containing protein n=1 Tax=Panagrolaimus sp. PS1159 TaxID=55785 RepID=A0AC35EZ25_9BILA